MWYGKFTERSLIKGWDILLRGGKKFLEDDADDIKDKGVISTFKNINKMDQNDLILFQEEMICFHTIEKIKNRKAKTRR